MHLATINSFLQGIKLKVIPSQNINKDDMERCLRGQEQENDDDEIKLNEDIFNEDNFS